jgi:hypothetical protein
MTFTANKKNNSSGFNSLCQFWKHWVKSLLHETANFPIFVPKISGSVKVDTPQKAIVYPQNSETMFQVSPTEDLLVFLNGILLACAMCIFFLHVLDRTGAI